MAGEKETDTNCNQARVRDFLTPELERNFEYIYSRLVAAGLKKNLTMEDAENYAQDAIVHALQKRESYTPREGVPLVAWLRKVAHYRFIDRIRRRQLEQQILADAENRLDPVPREPDQELQLLNAQAAQRRDRLLLALPDGHREVFMVWVEQDSGKINRTEAAERLGVQNLAEYEAAKKKVRRSVIKTMAELGYDVADLLDQHPREEDLKTRASYEKQA